MGRRSGCQISKSEATRVIKLYRTSTIHGSLVQAEANVSISVPTLPRCDEFRGEVAPSSPTQSKEPGGDNYRRSLAAMGKLKETVKQSKGGGGYAL